jgi:hypothetical protein
MMLFYSAAHFLWSCYSFAEYFIQPCCFLPFVSFRLGVKNFYQLDYLISRQSSPTFAYAPTHDSRDPSLLYSHSLYLNLTYPHWSSYTYSTENTA